MAETFLHELLQSINSVQSGDQDRDCVICLQETGTMSRETGFVELQLRLPCNHIVGSGCITIWLQANNSCPLCRREFFPAQPRPYLEHGVMEGQEHEAEEEGEEDRLGLLGVICEDYCSQLGLDHEITRIAKLISYDLSRRDVFRHRHGSAVVALAIYIASCVSGHPRSPGEIEGVVNVDDDPARESDRIDGDHIRECYGLVYERRVELITYSIRRLLEDRNVLSGFVWPSIGHERSDEEIERGRNLLAMKRLLADYSEKLHLTFPVDYLAEHIAGNLIRAGFRDLGYPETSSYVSPMEVAIVSIYVASHLVGQPVSRRAIRDLDWIGIDLRSTYRIVRAECAELVGEDFQEIFDLDLSWESLEKDVAEESDDGGRGDREDDDSMMEDQSNYGEALRGESTGDVSASTVSRIQGVTDLCNDYCNRLALTNGYRANFLARELGEYFAHLATFADHGTESIAAACVYMACELLGHFVTFEDLETLAAMNVATIDATHALMLNQLDEGSMRSIIDSMMETDP